VELFGSVLKRSGPVLPGRGVALVEHRQHEDDARQPKPPFLGERSEERLAVPGTETRRHVSRTRARHGRTGLSCTTATALGATMVGWQQDHAVGAQWPANLCKSFDDPKLSTPRLLQPASE
jgi:hypothetical protein